MQFFVMAKLLGGIILQEPRVRPVWDTVDRASWDCLMEVHNPGDLAQTDHMTGRRSRKVQTVDPVSHVVACQVFSRTSAGNAKRFPRQFWRTCLPSLVYPGRWGVEAECAAWELPLFVLLLRHPLKSAICKLEFELAEMLLDFAA